VSKGETSPNDIKDKIRTCYRGLHPDKVKVIPTKPQEDIFKRNGEKRVAFSHGNKASETKQHGTNFENSEMP